MLNRSRSVSHSSAPYEEESSPQADSQDRLGNSTLQSRAGLESGSGITNEEAMSWLQDETTTTEGSEATSTKSTTGDSDDAGADDAEGISPDVDLVGKEDVPGGEDASNGEAEAASFSADVSGELASPTAEASSLEVEAQAVSAPLASLSSGGSGEAGGLDSEMSAAVEELTAGADELKVGVEGEMARYGDEEATASASEDGSATEEAAPKDLLIEGMTPSEILALSVTEKRSFLEGFGVPAKDLKKAKDNDIEGAILDMVTKAQIPGNHNVKLKIKGGLFKKSYDITLTVTEDGGLEGVEVKKKSGFFSKLAGVLKSALKIALPLIAKALAPMTGGLSLLALGVYDVVMAIKNKDWLGAIAAAAGGVGGFATEALKNTASLAAKGLNQAAKIASGIQKVALTAKTGLAAIKAKNPGALLGALSTGASAVAGFASDKSGKFATTLEKWSTRLDNWSKLTKGGTNLVAAVKGKDPLEAMTAALDIVGNLRKSGKIEAAERLTSSASKVQLAITSKDPDAIAKAMLSLSEAIELAKAGDDKEKGAAISARYSDSALVVSSSINLVRAVKSGKWEDAVSSSAGLVGALSKDGHVDAAAKIASKAAALSKAIRSGDEDAIASAAWALGTEVQGVYADEKRKREAAAKAKAEDAANTEAAAAEAEIASPLVVPGLTSLPATALNIIVPYAPTVDSNLPDLDSATPPVTENDTKPKYTYSSYVSTAQRQLNLWSDYYKHYIVLVQDGYLGEMTEALLSLFQKSTPGLKETGKLDSATMKKLLEFESGWLLLPIHEAKAADDQAKADATKASRDAKVAEAMALVTKSRLFISDRKALEPTYLGFSRQFMAEMNTDLRFAANTLWALAAHTKTTDVVLQGSIDNVRALLKKLEKDFEEELGGINFKLGVAEGIVWTTDLTFEALRHVCPALSMIYFQLSVGLPGAMEAADWPSAARAFFIGGGLAAVKNPILDKMGGAVGLGGVIKNVITGVAIGMASDVEVKLAKIKAKDKDDFNRQARLIIKTELWNSATNIVAAVAFQMNGAIDPESVVGKLLQESIIKLLEETVLERFLNPLVQKM